MAGDRWRRSSGRSYGYRRVPYQSLLRNALQLQLALTMNLRRALVLSD